VPILVNESLGENGGGTESAIFYYSIKWCDVIGQVISRKTPITNSLSFV